MKSFKEFIQESSLSRLWQHLDSKNVIAMFSASRSENTKDQNKENTKQLKFRTKQAGFGYVPIKGGYVETLNDGTVINVVENSLIVFTTHDREQELYQFVVSMGIYYHQDSILFIDSNGDAYWIATINDSTIIQNSKIGDKRKLGKFHYKQIGNYFSQIGKTRFSFEPLSDIIKESDSKTSLLPSERMMGDILMHDIRQCIEQNKNYWES